MPDELFEIMGEPKEVLPVPVEKIDVDVLIHPNAEFMKSVKQFGIQVPIIVYAKKVEPGSNEVRYGIIDGRRRVCAARILEIPVIHAFVYIDRPYANDVLSVHLNKMRSQNIITEYKTVKKLVDLGKTMDEIINATGLTKSVVLKRMKLDKLPPPIMEAVMFGKVSTTVAEMVSSMSEVLQVKAVDIFKKNGRLTSKDVSGLRKIDIEDELSLIHDEDVDAVVEENRTDQLSQFMSYIPVEILEEIHSDIMKNNTGGSSSLIDRISFEIKNRSHKEA